MSNYLTILVAIFHFILFATAFVTDNALVVAVMQTMKLWQIYEVILKHVRLNPKSKPKIFIFFFFRIEHNHFYFTLNRQRRNVYELKNIVLQIRILVSV